MARRYAQPKPLLGLSLVTLKCATEKTSSVLRIRSAMLVFVALALFQSIIPADFQRLVICKANVCGKEVFATRSTVHVTVNVDIQRAMTAECPNPYLCLTYTDKCCTKCPLTLPTTDNREKIYKEVFRWTLPKYSINSEATSAKTGQVITFTCDNGFLKNEFISNTYSLQCDNGKFNRTFLYEDLLCRSDQYKNVVVSDTAPSQFRSKLFKCAEPGYKLYQVKLKQKDGKLKLLYSSCVDKKNMRSKFGHQPRRIDKPMLSHRQDDAIWGFDGVGENTNERFYLSKGYVKKIQAKRIARAYQDKYGQSKDYPYYFNRGHLVAMADFNDDQEQRATCEYLNAAPQWSEFNSGSWSLVEREARAMLQNNTNDWEIYTGTYGIIPTPRGLLHVSPVFNQDGSFKKQLTPVPMLYWKIVHNLKDKTKSRAFVGVNNPEFKSPEEIPRIYKICNPIKPNGEGVYYKGNENFGFTYECEVDELLEQLKKYEKIVK